MTMLSGDDLYFHEAVEVDVFQTAEAKMNLLVHDSFWGKQVILAADCF